MKHLNIRINLDVVPFAQKIEDERYGRADIFRSAWVADYPDPASFLQLFYGKSVPASPNAPSWPNSSRYISRKFDELYDKGVKAVDKTTSYDYFAEAENLLMEDAPVIILFYGENYIISQSFVRNLYNNSLNYLDLSQVYFRKPSGALPGAG